MNTGAGQWPVKSHPPSWNSNPCTIPTHRPWHLAHLFQIPRQWLWAVLGAGAALPPCPRAMTPAGARGYLHGVDSDGEGRVVPVHLALLARVLVPHGSLVRGADPEHAQDDHEHQEADTHHDHHRGCAGDNCSQKHNLLTLTVLTTPPLPSPARGNGYTQVFHVYYYFSDILHKGSLYTAT